MNPFCPDVRLKDWRNTIVQNRPGDNIDRPWSSPELATQPLQAEPWLGETWFEIQNPEPEENTGLGSASDIPLPNEDVNLFDDDGSAAEASPAEPAASRASPYEGSATTSSGRAHSYGPLRFRSRDSKGFFRSSHQTTRCFSRRFSGSNGRSV